MMVDILPVIKTRGFSVLHTIMKRVSNQEL